MEETELEKFTRQLYELDGKKVNVDITQSIDIPQLTEQISKKVKEEVRKKVSY